MKKIIKAVSALLLLAGITDCSKIPEYSGIADLSGESTDFEQSSGEISQISD